jgi:ABC-2 type transport system permease protein
MLLIAKKEIKNLFDQPTAYILLIIFTSLSYYFYFRTAFLTEEASLRPFFDMLPWIFMFFVPAVTMRALSVERREGTLELLLAQPINEFDVLTGKLLGNFGFLTAALFLTFTLPVTLLFGGKPDLGVIAAQYIGALLLLAAMVSVGTFASSLTENQTAAFIIAAIINFFLIVSGIEFITSALPSPVDLIFSKLSVLDHFQNISKGVIDLRDIIYFASVLFTFAGFTYFNFLRQKMNRRSTAYRNLKAGAVLIAAISITVNLFSGYINQKLDLTADKLYSLSPATRTIIRNLNDIVTVKFYASSKLPSYAELKSRDIKDMLGDIKSESGGNIKLQTIDPEKSEDSRFETQIAGIQPVNFNVMKQDEYQVKQGYLGMTINYANKKEVIPFVKDTDGLEYKIVSLIKKVTSSSQKKVAFLTGHQERNSSSDYAAFKSELSKQYKVEDFTIKPELKEISQDYKVIIIGGPQKWIREDEQKLLDKYMEKGGSVFFLMDGVSIDPQTSNVQRNMNGTMKTLLKYTGATVGSGLLYDLKSNESVPFSGGQVSYILPYPFWVRAQSVSKEAMAGDVDSIVMPWASPIKLDKKKTKGMTVKPLFATSRAAGKQDDNYNINASNNPAFKRTGLKSYVVATSIVRPGGGRLIIVGDSDFLLDNYLGNYPENMSFGLNAVDWLAQDPALISIRSKNTSPRRLLFSSDGAKARAKYFNMVGLPILVAIFGVAKLLKRRRFSRMIFKV